MIPYGRQSINDDDIDAVVSALRSDFLTQGPLVPEFEQAICNLVGAKYGVAVNSATSALHIACLALGAGPGDIVWTSPNSFVASSNCALYCGADVDFVDIDIKTLNMSIESLSHKLKIAKEINKLPKILIPVHFSGQSCDMQKIAELSQEYGFRIIEDASHAIGGKYHGEYIGNCRYSDITIFSFHPVKIITTGEGGIALTNDAVLSNSMSKLRAHGITRNALDLEKSNDSAWYYEQQALGFNYRLTDIQAALGLSQLKRINSNIQARHKIANFYNEMLEALPIILPWQDPDVYSAFHLYVVQIKLSDINISRKKIFDYLRDNGIGVNVHYIPIHLQPYYQRLGFKKGDFPAAEEYYEAALSLPIYPGLDQDDQEKVVRYLKQALNT